VFARKPAPLQYTWLGYLSTTGLDAIDYRLCDRHTDPPGVAEAWQVEMPARMPDSQWCYSPLFEVPQPGPLPRLQNGYWTFGSTNQIAKLNRHCLAVWARVLNSVRDSRLRVLGAGDAWVGERLLREFGRHGIAPSRIDLVGRLPLRDYLASYKAVDILLDSFPYNGGTTTCDSLLMGVPVATIAGDRSIARGGVSLLGTVGLGDWIAADEDALPELLLRKTADAAGMAALRAELPPRMRASPLMDGPRYARNFSALLRDAWRSWCARRREE
jgi:predicted O-linked N-acetylglucosamine transferase (SPINDLY family)